MKWQKAIREFETKLFQEEKAELTVQKYLRDIRGFLSYIGNEEITRELVLRYKKDLRQQYKISSVNSMLAAVNLFLEFLGLKDYKVKQYRTQKTFFCKADEYLTQEEYKKMVRTAEEHGERKISLIMQTLCSTGIRISELSFITVQAAVCGNAYITNKGKTRKLMIPSALRKLLLEYCREEQIKKGVIFLSRKGDPIDRSVVWKKMKKICQMAGIEAGKVFPHNLRHLFAVTFYKQEKDIVCLAEILGHGSIETTRIYTRTTGDTYEMLLSGLGLICGGSIGKSHNHNYVTKRRQKPPKVTTN